MSISELVLQELGSDNPMDVTISQEMMNDRFFQEMAIPQFVPAFGKHGLVGGCSRLALFCFQAGMLYERALNKLPQEKKTLHLVAASDETPACENSSAQSGKNAQ